MICLDNSSVIDSKMGESYLHEYIQGKRKAFRICETLFSFIISEEFDKGEFFERIALAILF